MHAYVILAHKNLGQLPCMIDTLDTGAASFFLHLDRNTNAGAYEREIRQLSRIPNVHWVERHRSSWATAKRKALGETIFRAIKYKNTPPSVQKHADISRGIHICSPPVIT